MPSPAGCVCPGTKTASVIRAALLHDFFGYDWHGERFPPLLRAGIPACGVMMRMHAFVQAISRPDRAKHTFGLTERECEAIARHMFPLAAMPRTRIAWIVTLADKAVASREMVAALGGYISLPTASCLLYNWKNAVRMRLSGTAFFCYTDPVCSSFPAIFPPELFPPDIIRPPTARRSGMLPTG